MKVKGMGVINKKLLQLDWLLGVELLALSVG